MRKLSFLSVAVLALACACNARAPLPPAQATQEPASPAAAIAAAPSFVDHVWVVTDSPQVAAGDTRAFLRDGVMVMTSPNAATALGSWRYENDKLHITEEGIEYPVEILDQSAEALRIRILGPGEPVVIGLGSGGPVLHLRGTVKYLDLEGGLYVIQDAEGRNYNVPELPAAYRVDGRAIEVDARRRDDVMSIGMVGPIIEILRVRNP